MTTKTSGRDVLEALALLVGLGFAGVAFAELSDRLRRRFLARMDGR